MKIAHLKFTTFVSIKTGFDKRVGYVTVACVGPVEWKNPVECMVAVSFCQPGEVFKKKHGTRAVVARLERSKSFSINADKSDWLQKAILGFSEADPSWVMNAVDMWYKGLNYNFGNVVIDPITFLNGEKLRK